MSSRELKTYTNEFNEYKTITANAIKQSICKWFPDKSARTRVRYSFKKPLENRGSFIAGVLYRDGIITLLE